MDLGTISSLEMVSIIWVCDVYHKITEQVYTEDQMFLGDVISRFDESIKTLELSRSVKVQCLKESKKLTQRIWYITRVIRITLPLKFTKNIHWTGSGYIDMARIISEWLQDPSLDDTVRFNIAAQFYCKDQIVELWNRMTEVSKRNLAVMLTRRDNRHDLQMRGYTSVQEQWFELLSQGNVDIMRPGSNDFQWFTYCFINVLSYGDVMSVAHHWSSAKRFFGNDKEKWMDFFREYFNQTIPSYELVDWSSDSQAELPEQLQRFPPDHEKNLTRLAEEITMERFFYEFVGVGSPEWKVAVEVLPNLEEVLGYNSRQISFRLGRFIPTDI